MSQSKAEFGQDLLAGMGDIQAVPARPRAPSATSLHANAQELERVRKELRELQAKAAEGSAQGMLLDPRKVKLSPWANRSALSYRTKDFQDLRKAIAKTGGNVQAGGVYKDEHGEWVLVFGHRRHQVCLLDGYKFKALELPGDVNPRDIFEAMYMENAERKSLSIYEQGVSFKLALETGLYESNRVLADRLGCSHTWVNQCIAAADLPEEIVGSWANPVEMKAGDVKKILETIKTEEGREMVLLRAALIQEMEEPLEASKVVMHLLYDDGISGVEKPKPMRLADKAKPYAVVRKDDKGQHHIKLPADFTPDEVNDLLAQVSKLAAKKKAFAQPQEKTKPAKEKKAKAVKDKKTEAASAEKSSD